jgi:hypothetical protein
MSTSTALVKKSTALVKVESFRLVKQDVNYNTRKEVKQHLPDICGKVLARAWHDKDYEKMLEDDLWGTFASGGVVLHDAFHLEYSKTSGSRAKITIYEKTDNANFKLRVCSLTLTMMANR